MGQRLPFEVVSFMNAVHDGVSTEHQQAQLFEASVARETGRLLAARLQMAAEALSFLGRDAEAVATLSACVDSGLIDIVWLDRCRLMLRLAERPGFSELRRVVAERASRVLVACR
jgi:hypothetical protein